MLKAETPYNENSEHWWVALAAFSLVSPRQQWTVTKVKLYTLPQYADEQQLITEVVIL